jgi:hypothetical protein
METISFELAKRLDKLGVKQKNEQEAIQNNNLSWLKYKHLEKPLLVHNATYFSLEIDEIPNSILYGNLEERYTAYTLDEILEILPALIRTPNHKEWDELTPALQLYVERYRPWAIFKDPVSNTFKACYGADTLVRVAEIENKTAAEAAGQLLAWCIENNYIKPEEL